MHGRCWMLETASSLSGVREHWPPSRVRVPGGIMPLTMAVEKNICSAFAQVSERGGLYPRLPSVRLCMGTPAPSWPVSG